MAPADGRLVIGFLVAVVLSVVGALSLQSKLAPGILLDPISPVLWAIMIVMGLCAATAISVLVARRRAISTVNGSQVVAMLGALGFVCFIIPAALLRDSVQWVAFAGLPSPTEVRPFTVENTHIDWWSKRNAYFVDVVMPLETRTVSLRVSDSVYRATRPGLRINLLLQTGRGGLRRVIPPNPVTLADFHTD